MKYTITVAIILAGIMLLPSCASRNLTFAIGGCLPNIHPYSGPRAEILSFKKTSSTLKANGYVKTYCGGAKIRGSYTIKNKTIFLSWSISKSSQVTRCICAYSVSWKIDKLPPGEFNVKLAP